MKRLFPLFIFIFIFAFPTFVLAIDASDYPDLPTINENWDNSGYLMTFKRIDGDHVVWELQYMSDKDNVKVRELSSNLYTSIVGPQYWTLYKAITIYDDVAEVWVVDDWQLLINNHYEEKTDNRLRYENLVYYNMDLYTYIGNVFYASANPCPPRLSLVLERSGKDLLSTVGGQVGPALKVSLLLLALFLVISLVRWLLRYYLLGRQ